MTNPVRSRSYAIFSFLLRTSERHEKDPFGQRFVTKSLLKKQHNDFSNNFRSKSLICRLLSIKCLLINQLLSVLLPQGFKGAKKGGNMSKSTFRILFYVRKNQVNKEGKASIIIRLTINGDTSQFSPKLEVEPELWNVSSQKMNGNSLKARQLNSLLDDVRTSLKNHFHDIETHEAYVTAEKVRNAFLGIRFTPVDGKPYNRQACVSAMTGIKLFRMLYHISTFCHLLTA